MSNLQRDCCLKFDFQKVEQHAGGKWLIHDTKRRKDNQLQSLILRRGPGSEDVDTSTYDRTYQTSFCIYTYLYSVLPGAIILYK